MLSAAKHMLSFVESNQKRIPRSARDDNVGVRAAATASVPSNLRPYGFIGTTLDVSCGPPSSSKQLATAPSRRGLGRSRRCGTTARTFSAALLQPCQALGRIGEEGILHGIQDAHVAHIDGRLVVAADVVAGQLYILVVAVLPIPGALLLTL